MRKLIFILSIPLFFACKPSTKELSIENNELNSGNNELRLSKEQINLSGIKTGKITDLKISETIECTGSINVPPLQKASVSPIISGFIKTLRFNVGDRIEKGEVLATLTHPDFINLQKNYLEAKSQKDYLEQEYKRQGELTVENAASIKKMQKAKADFLSSEANYKSLKSQLQILGINTEQIVKEDFATEYKLIAPISGTVSNMNANTGKFIKSENCIYEIVNENVLNVELNIFEKDIEKIKKNQVIIFRLSNGNEKYETKINRIGAKINQENRSVKVFGTFDNKISMLKPGMHINASILLNELLVSVIPSSAVVDNEGNSYIFIKHKDSYKRVQINKGIEQNEYCQIKNITKEIKTSDIVINGSYYLMSAYELNE